MADVTAGIDAYFYLSGLTILMGGIALIVRFCYKSKCKEVTCGCIRIIRDIETEEREDNLERQQPMTPTIRT